ncbi:hypothetical protein K7432_013551 [Basidiobolus ranarum]|uniref:Uncharacterized protein n=1 Tax=Basidiobolus ranarum TaxID=34480 RepID=A0ABR2VR27_9FUNG
MIPKIFHNYNLNHDHDPDLTNHRDLTIPSPKTQDSGEWHHNGEGSNLSHSSESRIQYTFYSQSSRKMQPSSFTLLPRLFWDFMFMYLCHLGPSRHQNGISYSGWVTPDYYNFSKTIGNEGCWNILLK